MATITSPFFLKAKKEKHASTLLTSPSFLDVKVTNTDFAKSHFAKY